jgi:phosphoribosyl 1,2-cyclic phosphodiesterase
MSLFITSLNSGSNGNCYYVGNEKEAILIDAGISCREIEKRMKRLGLAMEKVKAVFISHEHSDHIKGVITLVKRFQVPVYITPATFTNANLIIGKHLLNSFHAHQRITVGSLTITAFPKCHDAADPYSFIIGCDKVNVGVFTDIGSPCRHVVKYFKQCNAAFLEANYDEAMLENGGYPYYLKKRISGDNGHLSNKQALQLFLKYKPSFMTHLFLSHLSENNNCPRLVQELFKGHSKGVEMIVASRFEETPVYHISPVKQLPTAPTMSVASAQLAFSF